MKQSKLSKEDIQKALGEQKPEEQQKKKITPTFIIHICEMLVGVAYAFFLAFGRLFAFKDSDFYQSLDVFAENKPIAWVRLVSLILLVIVIGTLGRIILKALSKNKTVTKKFSIAVMQLFGNLVKYIMVIAIICIALSAMGVDTAAIVGGLGIFALIIGLGITSLIEDIVAGIFIISERTFDVGDIIVVDGFRGTVVSIGVRSTKIADVGGDIRTMRNSSIGAVINLTDRTSCAAITIPIAREESLEKVEQIIRDSHIEKIKDTCPQMVGAPIYLGLCEITAKGVQMLLFIAACKEENRYDVERALYHGLKIMFESNGVKLGHAEVITTEED